MSPIRGRRRKQMQTPITTRHRIAITYEATGSGQLQSEPYFRSQLCLSTSILAAWEQLVSEGIRRMAGLWCDYHSNRLTFQRDYFAGSSRNRRERQPAAQSSGHGGRKRWSAHPVPESGCVRDSGGGSVRKSRGLRDIPTLVCELGCVGPEGISDRGKSPGQPSGRAVQFPQSFLFHDDLVYGRKQQFRPGDRCHRSPDFTTGFASELLVRNKLLQRGWNNRSVRAVPCAIRRAKIGAIRRVDPCHG